MREYSIIGQTFSLHTFSLPKIFKNITPFFLTQIQFFLFYRLILNIKLTRLKRGSLLKTRQKVSRSKFVGATGRCNVHKRDNPVLNTLNAR